ncbi:MAG: ABC transporter permease subunit [Sphingomonadales bacterium]|nr:ABC transporter permease subunit [Sphingomonadales bacterium]
MMRALLLVLILAVAPAAARGEIVVASKKFTESVILGEIAAGLARDAGFEARHRKQLGGSRIVFEALRGGHIDVYADYTGTLYFELLAGANIRDMTGLKAHLAKDGIGVTAPLGFINNYAIGMLKSRAEELGLTTISGLATRPELVFGFSSEFMERRDGWPALRDAYGLGQTDVRGIDHDLGYRALLAGQIDAIDLYTTDAEIAAYDLATLADDLGHFPVYEPVFLYRLDLSENAPAFVTALESLAGAIDTATMSAMNARVKIDGEAEGAVAAAFLADSFGIADRYEGESRLDRLTRNTGAHLALVAISLGAAILIAIPLGLLSARRPRLGQIVLSASGVLQTVPSLALFVFMIPLLGIGAAPTIAALFLYSLLPIIRNTHIGLTTIPATILESAEALGLSARARLRLIELPLALPTLLAGIKTAAVINVGTATLGAIIGAGGYGQPILTGIRLDDTALILEGAVPAAVLALLVQGLFDRLELWMTPRGLKLGV